MQRLFRWYLIGLIVLAGCASGPSTTTSSNQRFSCVPGAVDISIIYALNPQQNYMFPAIEQFNQAYVNGRNPLTGEPLAEDEPAICVVGELGSSSRTAQAIANTVIAPNNDNTVRPTMYAPSVSTWISLASHRAGREMFAEVHPIALTPIVMAIWESRLQAIQQGDDPLGWEELLEVLNSPGGWRDYGLDRRAVYYGHTDPRSSSTGLSALVMAYYAAARAEGFTDRRLTVEQVNDTTIQDGVRRIEQLVRHYSTRTDDYLDYIAQGADYVDFVALEEIDLLYLNGAFEGQGFVAPFNPPERIVALYPKEGTLWHERPVGILNGDWVSPEQQAAARTFVEYLKSEAIQRDIVSRGFRPVNPDVALGSPFIEEYGVDPAGPETVLDMPDAETLVAMQQSWALVKKPADVMLLIDVSGSMQAHDKLEQAQSAALAFVDEMDDQNQVGLATFSDEIRILQDPENLERSRVELQELITGLAIEGGTELYAAVEETVLAMNEIDDNARIRAVVVLSDGEDTGERGTTLSDAIRAIEASSDSANPVIVVPLAYGADADITALADIARASATRVQSGNPDDIDEVLRVIRSYF